MCARLKCKFTIVPSSTPSPTTSVSNDAFSFPKPSTQYPTHKTDSLPFICGVLRAGGSLSPLHLSLCDFLCRGHQTLSPLSRYCRARSILYFTVWTHDTNRITFCRCGSDQAPIELCTPHPQPPCNRAHTRTRLHPQPIISHTQGTSPNLPLTTTNARVPHSHHHCHRLSLFGCPTSEAHGPHACTL